MNAPLSPRIERLILQHLQSGSYKDATEVIEDAFDALAERENVEAIRAELDRSDEQLARGEFSEFDENTIQKLAERVKARGQARLVEERRTGTQ